MEGQFKGLNISDIHIDMILDSPCDGLLLE